MMMLVLDHPFTLAAVIRMSAMTPTTTLTRVCMDNSDDSEHFSSKMSIEGEVINPEITDDP